MPNRLISGADPATSIEHWLAAQDPVIGRVISALPDRWSAEPNDRPCWGLVRIVIAQQISTQAARTLTRRVAEAYPELSSGELPPNGVEVARLRACGLSPRKAECCSQIVGRISEIDSALSMGGRWEDALEGIRGIGPWTLDLFRIIVLRETDVLPAGDAGLVRAVAIHYGVEAELRLLAERWRPYRSVACWYLWRSLGNPPLG